MTEVELDHTIAVIESVNGSAARHLDDPYLRNLLRHTIAGELTVRSAAPRPWLT